MSKPSVYLIRDNREMDLYGFPSGSTPVQSITQYFTGLKRSLIIQTTESRVIYNGVTVEGRLGQLCSTITL
jgi:hypothetical protein